MRISSTLTMPAIGIGKTSGNQQSKIQSKASGPFDSLSISATGKGISKSSSILESLAKQKQNILENKNNLINSTTENGKSLESIKDLLEAYNDQLKAIDEQIAQTTIEEQKKSLGADKKEIKIQSQNPKTKEEIVGDNLSKIVSIAANISQTEVVSSVKDKLEGELNVLNTEIKLDKAVTGEASSGKLEKVSELKTQINDLNDEVGQKLNETLQELSNNNDSSTQSDTVGKDMESNKSPESENSDIDYKIANYKNMQEKLNNTTKYSILDVQA